MQLCKCELHTCTHDTQACACAFAFAFAFAAITPCECSGYVLRMKSHGGHHARIATRTRYHTNAAHVTMVSRVLHVTAASRLMRASGIASDAGKRHRIGIAYNADAAAG